VRLLLDTHVLLWWLLESPKLAHHIRTAMTDLDNDVCISAVTHAEISIKRSLGRLESPWIPDELLEENGFEPLPFTASHGRRMLELPFHHRDPFDRMLIAQAIDEDMVFATVDPRMHSYGVRILGGP
jgi:PIN domain nuclease of toxin-antitoxin system